MNQEKMPVAEALIKYINENRNNMHIPGHKGKSGKFKELEELFSEKTLKADITEIRGFDDFHDAEGIISEAEMLAAENAGADCAYFLVNGTTSGIIAAVCATVRENQLILVSGDCHKSVSRGLVLSGAIPLYAQNCVDREIMMPVGMSVKSVQKAFAENPEIKAVILTHPSYYGTYSDIHSIVEIAHRHEAVVIADEAHGAHLKYVSQGVLTDAISNGVDISVQSTHKMLGSLTQSSVMYVNSEKVDMERLHYFVSFMNSTSPSYLLMASIDAVRHRMAGQGRILWKEIANMTELYADVIDDIPGMNCVKTFLSADGEILQTDRCRLVVSAKGCGISGTKLDELLAEEYDTDVEFSDERYVIAVMGSNTVEDDIIRFCDALKDISRRFFSDEYSVDKEVDDVKPEDWVDLRAKTYMTPRKAVMSAHEVVDIRYAEGRVAAVDVAVYPPGIPFLRPGEIINADIMKFILRSVHNEVHVHGITCIIKDGKKQILISVVEECE